MTGPLQVIKKVVPILVIVVRKVGVSNDYSVGDGNFFPLMYGSLGQSPSVGVFFTDMGGH